MRLVPCTPPTEPLDVAPQTALARDTDGGGSWEGFWSSATDAYYARQTWIDGRIEWFRMDDESPVRPAEAAVSPRVLPFRGDGMRRVALVVAASPNGRPMLVGSSKRSGR